MYNFRIEPFPIIELVEERHCLLNKNYRTNRIAQLSANKDTVDKTRCGRKFCFLQEKFQYLTVKQKTGVMSIGKM